MYKKEKTGWLKHLDFIVLDLIVFQLCYILSYWILRGISNPYKIVLYRYQAIVYLFCQLIVVLVTESYKNVLRRSTFMELTATFRYIAGVEILNLLYLFSVHQIYMISRLLTGLTAVMFFIVSFIARLINKKRILDMRKDQKGQRSLMVITSSHLVDQVISELTEHSFHRTSSSISAATGWMRFSSTSRTISPIRPRWSIPCSIWESLSTTVSPP